VGWTGVRLPDWMWATQYLIDLATSDIGTYPVPVAEVPFLSLFTATLHNNMSEAISGWDTRWFVPPSQGGQFPTDAVPGHPCSLQNHGVNTAMPAL
jgi:hypothetical protein